MEENHFFKILSCFCDEDKLSKFYFWMRERFTHEEIENMRSDVGQFAKMVDEYVEFNEKFLRKS